MLDYILQEFLQYNKTICYWIKYVVTESDNIIKALALLVFFGFIVDKPVSASLLLILSFYVIFFVIYFLGRLR